MKTAEDRRKEESRRRNTVKRLEEKVGEELRGT